MFGYASALAGRTSVATCVALLLLSLASLLVRRVPARGLTLSNLCSALAGALSGLALMGYAYGVGELYDMRPFDDVALHTAAALFTLALASSLMRTDRGWAAVVASGLAGGAATRRQLGVTLVITIVGWLLLRATETRGVGPGMALALLVSLTVGALTALILRDGRMQDELDRERNSRTEALAENKALLERELASRVAALDEANRERARAEDALRQAQKMEAIGQLTGGVAHDFKNLLTVIRSSADLLKRANLTEARRGRYVEAISQTADRAVKLTSQLLAFARRQALKPEVFDVGRSVSATAGMVACLTGARIRVAAEVPAEPCFVDADPSQFETALVNMAVNARDAMDGEGRLTIAVATVAAIPGDPAPEAERDGGYVALTMTDTGSGIPAGDLHRIFEPFFTTKGVGHGTGLGLSQVFGFLKQSGGEVRVDSTPGTGTTFALYLPRVGRPETPEVTRTEAEPIADGQGTCVLVVEDNADVGAFAIQSLDEFGYSTVWAVNAAEALGELAKDAGRFDVVFSDVMMPGMDGIDLGRRIRILYDRLPVLLTSRYSHVLARDGASGFDLLHKPYSVEQLSRTLREAAGRRHGRPPRPPEPQCPPLGHREPSQLPAPPTIPAP